MAKKEEKHKFFEAGIINLLHFCDRFKFKEKRAKFLLPSLLAGRGTLLGL
jgi:hypothetical protein